MSAEYVRFGRFEVLKSELKGKTIEQAQKKFPNVRGSWLTGAWNLANEPEEKSEPAESEKKPKSKPANSEKA